jgi:predicted nucleic acid-binding protein
VPHFLDTNILLYSISSAPAEALKRDKAIMLLADDDGSLSIQVLQEFYVQATRATRTDPISHEDATGLIRSWSRFRVQDMTPDVLNSALEIRRAYRFSFWDSAIVAAAKALRCDRIYTEDLADGQVVEGMTVINPFLSSVC